MAIRRDAVVLITSRCLTLFFAGAALKTFLYNSTDHTTTPVPISGLGLLDLALWFHIVMCSMQLLGLVASVLMDRDPIPEDRGMLFLVIFGDLMPACLTFGNAIAAGSVTADFAMTNPRIIEHAGLACMAGLSGLFTAAYPAWISVPRPVPHQQLPV